MFAKCVLATILAYLSLCDTYKILVVFPFPAKSHNNLGNGIVRHLLKAGHEVSMLMSLSPLHVVFILFYFILIVNINVMIVTNVPNKVPFIYSRLTKFSIFK